MSLRLAQDMEKLIKCWTILRHGFTLSVYTSSCVVTKPPPCECATPIATSQRSASMCRVALHSHSRALVNPSNEELIGTALPYFPMAAPPPRELRNTSWGGASAGNGSFYSAQTVDGIVSLHGGKELREACKRLPVHDVPLIGGGGSSWHGSVRCPVGSAVVTNAHGNVITEHFRHIIHTVPPLFRGLSEQSSHNSSELLTSGYREAFKVGFGVGADLVTSPLVGAGSRGAPVSLAIQCAVEGVFSAMEDVAKVSTPLPSMLPRVVQFVLQDERIANELAHAIENHEIDAFFVRS